MTNLLKVSVFFILSLFSLATFAQKSYSTFGVHAGVNRLDVSADEDFDPKVGYQFSASYDYTFASNVFVGTAFGFHKKFYGIDGYTIGLLTVPKRTASATCFQVPVLAGYKLNLENNNTINFSGGAYGFYNMDHHYWNGGLQANVGATFNRILLNLGYEHGFKGSNKNSHDYKFRTLYLTFGVRI